MSIVTITNNVGCGGCEIASIVAQKLEIPLYDDLALQAEALKLGITLPDLEGLDEVTPGLFDRILTRRPDSLLDIMESVVFAVAQKGQGVIIGHGSQVLLRDFVCAFHTRIYSPIENRMQRIMEKRGLERTIAADLIQKNDSRQDSFFRFAFQENRDALALYDLNLNTAKIAPEAAADLIVSAVNNPMIRECTLNSLEAMGRLSLVKRIEAELLKHFVDLNYISVQATGDKVIVSGLVPTKTDLKIIEKQVQEAATNAIQVELNLTLTPTGF